MPQSLSKIYLHIIYSTKGRIAFFEDIQIRQELHSYLAKTLQDRNCFPLLIGGMADHVHILCTLCSADGYSKIIGEIKRYSSKWIKTKGELYSKFAWQRGYGAFSVSHSEIQRVRNYILNQEKHHHKMSFQEEYREFLKRYEVEFDEQYVWD